MHIFVRQVGKLGPQQLFKVFLRDGGHLDDCKAGSQGLVQLPGARVAIVHGGDEAGLFGQRDALVAGHINGAAEVQHGVEDGQGLVFGHVDLVQHKRSLQSNKYLHVILSYFACETGNTLEWGEATVL